MANWSNLDEYSLWKIFSYLQITDICKVSLVCKNWYFVANDDFLWKLKFAQHFNLKNNQLLTLPPASKSWKAEVKRLLFTIPSGSNSEELKSPHQLEITNVCFSRDGNFFATCGMDSRVVLWNSSGILSIILLIKYTVFPRIVSAETILFWIWPYLLWPLTFTS